MKIIPTKVLVYHAPESDSVPPCDSWLQYWSETLEVDIPKSGYFKCHCCKENRNIKRLCRCSRRLSGHGLYLSNL